MLFWPLRASALMHISTERHTDTSTIKNKTNLMNKLINKLHLNIKSINIKNKTIILEVKIKGQTYCSLAREETFYSIFEL